MSLVTWVIVTINISIWASFFIVDTYIFVGEVSKKVFYYYSCSSFEATQRMIRLTSMGGRFRFSESVGHWSKFAQNHVLCIEEATKQNAKIGMKNWRWSAMTERKTVLVKVEVKATGARSSTSWRPGAAPDTSAALSTGDHIGLPTRQHCRLSICEYWLSWTNTVSEAKIQITLLLLWAPATT